MTQDLGHGARTDLHTQTGKLPDDALVPPPGILTGETQNKLAQLVCHRRPTRPPPSIGPASPNKLAMPMQQGVWTHEERWPSSEEPAGCSEKHTIGILQTRANDLAAKNRELVSKHDDLELLELTRTETQRRHRERTPKVQIHKRDSKSRPSSTTMSYGLKPAGLTPSPLSNS